ncbi:hypothetical protein A6M13_12050 [Caryophanon tenue]|uniref:Uncharacterized protein n=1 Tax=Caryophanon tenue TaxID=33978 RepID=A0A1C0YIC9_9BACL|nr:hypothetical protein A6M13_12050 [Caryophanon tenue]
MFGNINKKRDWDKRKYPSAMTTAEGYFSALGATPHSGRVSQAWPEANTMFVTSALPHDVAFLADVPLLKAHAPTITRRRKTLLFLQKSPLVSERTRKFLSSQYTYFHQK